MSNVIDHLLDTDATAIISPNGEKMSYSALRKRVGTLAGGLAQQGIREGDRVVLLIPMSLSLYIHLLALFHLGATATLIDPAANVQKLLTLHPPDGLIGIPKAHLLRLKVPALRGLKLSLIHISEPTRP